MPSKSQSTSFFYEDLFGARKSIRYHQRRRSFFENLHTIASALQVVAGSSAVATMVSDHPYWGAGMAAIAAVPAPHARLLCMRVSPSSLPSLSEPWCLGSTEPAS